MARDAYKYNNLIIIQNGLSGEGIYQVKELLNTLTKTLIGINENSELTGLTVPFQLQGSNLLACKIEENTVNFYHVQKIKEPGARKPRFSEAINVYDSRVLYHGIGIIQSQVTDNIRRYTDVYREYNINGLMLKINAITAEAERNNNYSQEYRILNIDNVRDMLER